MRAENIISEPIKKTYKYGVYSACGVIGICMTAFIAWSFACLGGAGFDLVSKLV